MKAMLANWIWDILAMVSIRAHDWVFDPERHARIRMKHRERWWAYHLKATFTESKRDDMRAKAWETEFKFETPPADARARGDLKPYPTH